MKVADLIGAELDYWVARAEGVPHDALSFVGGNRPTNWEACSIDGAGMYRPSIKWEIGGPIIERERIAIDPITRNRSHTAEWQAQVWVPFAVQTGATPLIAAMRAFVAGKFSDEVSEEIGDENNP